LCYENWKWGIKIVVASRRLPLFIALSSGLQYSSFL
jgi:hypothetical protein